MRLTELAEEYDEAVLLLRQRIRDLEDRRKSTQDVLEQNILAQRTADLRAILRDTRTLAVICRRYYERSFWRDEHFCFQYPGQRAPWRRGCGHTPKPTTLSCGGYAGT